MPGSTEHQIRRELDDLRDEHSTDSALADVRVEWRDAAPDERPEG